MQKIKHNLCLNVCEVTKSRNVTIFPAQRSILTFQRGKLNFFCRGTFAVRPCENEPTSPLLRAKKINHSCNSNLTVQLCRQYKYRNIR